MLEVNNVLISKVARAIAMAHGFNPDAHYPVNINSTGADLETQTGEQKFWGDALAAIAAWEVLARESNTVSNPR